MATYMIPEIMCQPAPPAQCMTMNLPKDRSPYSDRFRKLVGDFAEASLDMLSRPPGMRWEVEQLGVGDRRFLVRDGAAVRNDARDRDLSQPRAQQQCASARVASQDGGRPVPFISFPAEIRDMIWEMTLDILEPETFTAIHRYRPPELPSGEREPSSSPSSLSSAGSGGAPGDQLPQCSRSQWLMERQGPRMRSIAAYWVCRESRRHAVRAYGDPAAGQRLLFFNPHVDRVRFSVLSSDWILSSQLTITTVGSSTMVDMRVRASAANGQRLARELDALDATAPGGQVISLWGGGQRDAGAATGGAADARCCWRRNGRDPAHPGAMRPGPERYLNEGGRAVLFAVGPALLGRVERLDLLLYCDPFRDTSRMALGFSSVLSPTFTLRELHSVLRAFPAIADLRLCVGVQFHRATLDAPHRHRHAWWHAFLASFTGLRGPPPPRRDSGMWLGHEGDYDADNHVMDVDGQEEGEGRDEGGTEGSQGGERGVGEGEQQSELWGLDLASELFEPPILWSNEDPLPPAYQVAFAPGRYRTWLPRLARLEVCQAHCFPAYGKSLDTGDDVCGFRFCEDPACNSPLGELVRG